MSPAERKFCNVEGGLTRAQCLVRVLRDLLDGPARIDDRVFWGGLYIIVCEAETSLDAAAEVWTEAHGLASGRPKS